MRRLLVVWLLLLKQPGKSSLMLIRLAVPRAATDQGENLPMKQGLAQALGWLARTKAERRFVRSL